MSIVSQVNIPITAVDRASHVFERIGAASERMIAKISAIASIATLTTSLSLAFGGANREAAALATGITIFSSIVNVATSALIAFNVPLTWTVALATMGVGAVLALAAAMAMLAAQSNTASRAMGGTSAETSRIQETYVIHGMSTRGIER